MSPQDLIVIITALIAIAYGYVIGRSRVVAALLGLYAGYAILTLAGPAITEWLAGRGIVSFSSLPWIQLTILSVVVALFLYRFKLDATIGRAKGLTGHVLTALLAFLTAMLGLTFAVDLLAVAGQSWGEGAIASQVQNLEVAWVTLPVLLWALLTFLRRA